MKTHTQCSMLQFLTSKSYENELKNEKRRRKIGENKQTERIFLLQSKKINPQRKDESRIGFLSLFTHVIQAFLTNTHKAVDYFLVMFEFHTYSYIKADIMCTHTENARNTHISYQMRMHSTKIHR